MTLHGNWEGREIKDLQGLEFKVGDRVARAYSSGSSANIKISIVTKIENGKMYLDGSKVALHYPERLLILK